jgi:hypothetical protein
MSEDSLDMKAIRLANALRKAWVDLQPLLVDLATPPKSDTRRNPWAETADKGVPENVTEGGGVVKCEGRDCAIAREPGYMIALHVPFHETRYFHNEECLRNAG